MSTSKKDNVLNNKKPNSYKKLLWALPGLLVLALAAVLIFMPGKGSTPSNTDSSSGLLTQGDKIMIPAADFTDSTARYYRYNAGGKEVDFFMLRSSDGVIRAAFDACDVCFAAQKGYRQEGDFMVCNNCGQRFSSLRINEEKGGCNPSPLQRELIGDKVVIDFDDIAAGARYF